VVELANIVEAAGQNGRLTVVYQAGGL